MGLLDLLNSDQARLGLGLLAAAGPRADGAGFGQRLLEGVNSLDTWKDQQKRAKIAEMQMQQMQMQIEQAKAAQEAQQRQRQWQDGLQGVLGQKVYGASDVGPTMEPDTKALNDYMMSPDSPYRGKLLEKSLFPEKPEAYTLSEGQVRYQGNQMVARGPEKTDPKTEVAKLISERDQLPIGSPLRKVYDNAITKATTHQQGVKVEVPINLGQKGLDNTLKVRSDFRSEPIYKAHGEVQSAHSQISTALKQNSPAGDLAGATKLMKILDPGSVVRESELGMAMAASGLLDRAQNYADMVMKGTKLTPTQRKDFQTLADALLKESTTQYSAKRDEYKGIAERNQLSVPDILGPEPKIQPLMESLPNAAQHKGKTIRDTTTGKMLRSNGMNWQEVTQ